MSECRWCDTCGRVYSALDEGARRINVEEPVKVGARTEVQVIQRDMCADCCQGLGMRKALPATVVDPE